MNLQADAGKPASKSDLDSIVVRFAGDSGDGVQLLGSQFSQETALAGNSLATFPDYPAEIRAPTGTTYGVSAFQINFGSRQIKTAGDQPDVLVALNPAALMVNYKGLRKGALGEQTAQQVGHAKGDKKGVSGKPRTENARNQRIANKAQHPGNEGHAADRGQGF